MNKSLRIASEYLESSVRSQRDKDKLVADDIALEPRIYDQVKSYVTKPHKVRSKMLVSTHLAILETIDELYPSLDEKKLRVEVLTPDAIILADQKAPQIMGVPKQQFTFPEKNPPDVLYGIWGTESFNQFVASRIGDSDGTYGWAMASRKFEDKFLEELSSHTHTDVTILQGERILGSTLPKEVIISNFEAFSTQTGQFYMGSGAGGFIGKIFGLKEIRAEKKVDPQIGDVMYLLTINTEDLGNSLNYIFLISITFAIILAGLTAGFSFWVLRSVNNFLRYPNLILKRGLEGMFEPEAPPDNLPNPFQDIANNAYRVIMQVRGQSNLSPILKTGGGQIKKIDKILKEVPSQPASADSLAVKEEVSLPFMTPSDEVGGGSAAEAESDPLGIFSAGGTGEHPLPEEATEIRSAPDDEGELEVTAPRIGNEGEAKDSEMTHPSVASMLDKSIGEAEEKLEGGFSLGVMGDDTGGEEEASLKGGELDDELSGEGEGGEEEKRFDQERTMIASSADLEAILGSPGSHSSSSPRAEKSTAKEKGGDEEEEGMPFDALEDVVEGKSSEHEINPDEYNEDELKELLGEFEGNTAIMRKGGGRAEGEERGGEEEGATTIMQVPKGFWDKKPVIDEGGGAITDFEEHAKKVFEEYIRLRERLGENNKGMAFEKFLDQLKKNRKTLMDKHNCKDVRFEVYEKDGKAALKASPIKD
ncbi:MAG: hypothetical protein Kow0090_14170 [Myxococcota bacterium]